MISTHAPTRGATVVNADGVNEDGISTHAPTRGATFVFLDIRKQQKNFNPRSHKGSDIDTMPDSKLPEISTHAPTRGATFLSQLQ